MTQTDHGVGWFDMNMSNFVQKMALIFLFTRIKMTHFFASSGAILGQKVSWNSCEREAKHFTKKEYVSVLALLLLRFKRLTKRCESSYEQSLH